MVLTYTQLDTSLQNVILNAPTYYGQCIDAMSVLYLTGCRPDEIWMKTRWTDYDATHVRLLPLKGNVYRYLLKGDLPPNYLLYLFNDAKYIDDVTQRQVRYCFNHVYEYSNPAKGLKDSALYLFRYRYFKMLKENGNTDEDIRVLMGENTLSVAQSYIYASIVVD